MSSSFLRGHFDNLLFDQSNGIVFPKKAKRTDRTLPVEIRRDFIVCICGHR